MSVGVGMYLSAGKEKKTIIIFEIILTNSNLSNPFLTIIFM